MATLKISVSDPARLEVRATVVNLNVQVGGSGSGKELHDMLKVDASYGSDARAAADHNFPFRSITAAKAAAASGDTIVVFPGTYNEYNLAKDGVTIHFLPGAKVRYTGSVSGACIFSDNNVATEFYVTGKGQFLNLGTGGSNDCIRTQAIGTKFYIECDELYAATNRAVSNYDSLVEVTARRIQASDGAIDSIGYSNGNAVTRIKAGSITSFNNYVLEFDGGILEVEANELVAEHESFAAITTSSGTGSMRVRAKRIIAAGYGVEALGEGLVYLEGVNFETGEANFAEGRNSNVFVLGCTNGLSFGMLTGDIEDINYVLPFASNDETAAGLLDNKVTNPAGHSFSQDLENYRYRAIMDQVAVSLIAGNSIRSEATMGAIFKFYRESGYWNDIQLLLAAELGIRYSTSTIFSTVSKAYGMSRKFSDAYMATASNQPYLSGNIAPNEKFSLRNPNGSGRYMAHPNVLFSASEAWTICFVINWNGTNSTLAYPAGIGNSTFIRIKNAVNKFALEAVNYPSGYSSVQFNGSNSKIIGKAAIVHFVYDGAGNLSLYVNGVFEETLAWTLPVMFNALFTTGGQFYGDNFLHLIRRGAANNTQVAAEAAFLRTLFPEIKSVVIGSQTWATSNLDIVCTPMGNHIPEVQINSLTNRAVNGTFDSDTNWTKGSGHTISAGALNINAAPSTFSYQANSIGVDNYRYYKITYTISNFVSGSCQVYVGSSSSIIATANGTFTGIVKNNGATPYIYILTGGGITPNFSIDNIIVEELGWSNATEIYDLVYAATSGDAATKEYAAVKQAAMWCQYNNDSAYGAIFGKLYNWYAIRLLELDIANFNAANPTARWGWHLPTQAEWLSLQANQGGESTAGAGLKLTGTTHWLTPNTGATNLSGFTGLPGGRRNGDGSFSGLTGNSYAWTTTSSGSNAYSAELLYNATTLVIALRSKLEGQAIRLIKD